MTASQRIPYGALDQKTLIVGSRYKGRGIGDAFTNGTYKFEKGQFVLKKYEADETFDQKINPVTVVEYK